MKNGVLKLPGGALAAILISLAAASAPTPATAPGPEVSLADYLEAARAEDYLPLGFAVAEAAQVDVFFHREPSAALAYATPGVPGDADIDEASEKQPGGDAPRAVLSLYQPAYLDDAGAWRPLPSLTVDASEYLFNTLSRLYLERQWASETPLGRRLAERADELLATLPAAARREAYTAAAADFVSHALSVAGQLERSAREHRSKGSQICRHLDAPWSLFGGWGRIFGDGLYVVSYYPEPVNGAPPTAVRTDIGLEAEDKLLLRQSLLEDRWQGDRRTDLASRYCPEQAAAEAP